MKILVLNGSPKGAASNTMYITNAFVEGMNSVCKNEVEIVNLIEKDIKYCRGCFACFNSTEGKCAIQDDMGAIVESFKNADVIIYSTPIHTFGVSAPLKTMMDRLLVLHKPEIDDRDDEGEIHVCRYNSEHQRTVLIATCGFYCYEHNVEPVLEQFRIMRGENYEKIICAEGTMFRMQIEDIAIRTKPYLEKAMKAGEEYARNGAISEDTKKALEKRHFPRREYHQLANNYWRINEDGLSQEEKKRSETKRFVHQMAAIYEPISDCEGDAVLEFLFSDSDYIAQLWFSSGGCRVVEDKEEFKDYSILLRTSFVSMKKNASIGAQQLQHGTSGGSVGRATSVQMIAEKTVLLKKRNAKRELRL